MIRKIGVLGMGLLCLTAFVSCEKDFSDVGTNIVTNDRFETGDIFLDIEITPVDLEKVQADNINTTISEYWLGVYNNPNAKKVEASIVSQLGYVSGLKNTAGKDTILDLEKVILKLPYPSTSEGKNDKGITTYKLDSILGNPNVATQVTVKQNGTFLNRLNPEDPSKNNTFYSDFEYEVKDDLTEGTNFTFKPLAKDTLYTYDRINRLDPSKTYKDVIKTKTVVSGDTIPVPFLAIPLDVTKMKSLFWDKFESSEFTSKEAFDDYFRGLIIEAKGNDGAMVPFSLTSTPGASLEFYYTKSIKDANNKVTDTLNKKYRFPLTGIRNSTYKTTPNTTPVNNFVIQGTAGSMAEIKILDETKLQELRAQNLLINDASLTLYVNQEIHTNKDVMPQQLFLYQNKKTDAGVISPTQLIDIISNPVAYGGRLQLIDEKDPEKYTIGLTNYITNLLNGEEDTTLDPLVLKVYNSTDTPVNKGVISTRVRTYNWNPRFVALLNEDNTANGDKRAVLKISYSKEK